MNYQSTATRYTVQQGDTLASIAYALWGDASYWYLIADANGLDGSETLVGGQDLIIPDKIHNVHNNADTYRVYNPNEAMGDTSPTAPKPQKHHGGGCGVVGQIIMAVVAVVLAVLPGGILLDAAIMAVADAAMQGVAMLAGLQSSFNWGEVAGAAISGAVGGALGGAFSGLTGAIGSFGVGVLQGVTSNVLTQGIDMAVGLQSKFDWASVAVAGVAGGVSSAVVANAGSLGLGDMGAQGQLFVAGAAGAVASATTRSLLTGTDFGDNLMSALPNLVGTTIGNVVDGQINEWNTPQTATNSQTDNPTNNSNTPTAASETASVGHAAGDAAAEGQQVAENQNVAKPTYIESVVVTASRMSGAQQNDFDMANLGWWQSIYPGEASLVQNAGISYVNRFFGAIKHDALALIPPDKWRQGAMVAVTGVVDTVAIIADPERVAIGALAGATAATIVAITKHESVTDIGLSALNGAYGGGSTAAFGKILGEGGAVSSVTAEVEGAYASAKAQGASETEADISAGAALLVGGGLQLVGIQPPEADTAAAFFAALTFKIAKSVGKDYFKEWF